MSGPSPMPDNRWWQNYAVRYLVPTMTGMLFLRWLQLTTKGLFSPLLPAAGNLTASGSIFQNLSMPELLVWAGAGFAFAYLASLPILVFHATRSLDVTAPRAPALCSPPLATSLLLLATLVLATFKYFNARWPWYPICALLIVGLFSLILAYRLRATSRAQFRAAKYAEDVARGRSPKGNNESASWANEYVTSYRHLREHGNAAFIVLMQAILCTLVHVCLTSSPEYVIWTFDTSHDGQRAAYAFCILLLLIWVIPSVRVHHMSQQLEAYLAVPPTSNTSAAPALATAKPVDKGQGEQRPIHKEDSTPSSPMRHAARVKLALRMLKAVAQFSPWLVPLAFCPPILLLWFHLSDLHYPALLMPAISSTAGLGTLLLLGGLVWVLWFLSLAVPSLLIALLASLYDLGNVPRPLAKAWIGVGVAATLYCFLTTLVADLPAYLGFLEVYGGLAAILGFIVWRNPPPPVKADDPNKQMTRWQKALLASLVTVTSYLALCLLLLPLYLMGRAYGKEPESVLLVAGVIAFSFGGALLPGIFFVWFNQACSKPNQSRMSVSTFAATLLAPPMVSIVLLPAMNLQLRHLTLVSSGVTDRGGDSAKPALYRLPDKWTDQDRLLTNSFPPSSNCAKMVTSQPEPFGWLCGYRNFSFGTTQLVCDKPYANEIGQFAPGPLTCVTFVGNQVISLTTLQNPGPLRKDDAAKK